MATPDETYDAIRLETADGTVAAYFAPEFEITPQDANDIFTSPQARDDPPIARNNGMWQSELTIQGAFMHSETVGPAFRQALQNLFGKQTVTPTDQVNRLRDHTVYASQQGFHYFYHRDDEYTATSPASVDVSNGVYPAVVLTELRMPEDGARSTNQIDFLVRMQIGVTRGEQEPAQP